MDKHFYITTTLPYVNSDPHIGFALEIIRADVMARHYQSIGADVIFNTGTDEHGQKIYEKAKEADMDVQAYVDGYAAKFKELKEVLNLSFTNFIRTTDEHHVKAAQEFWKIVEANGDIYKKNYQVKYCIGCELEKQDSDLEDGKCPIHPSYELEMRDEENYFFKFSSYQEKLLDLYKSQPDFVVPEHRMKEISNFVEAGLQDFSISRLKEKMPWGVPVPGDEDHVMYVWFDALVNYISTLGWPNEASDFADFWPGVQIAGKDNLRQQTAMWQAMLMSAGIKPSKQVYIGGFITSDGQKMSKSIGNVISPYDIVEKYGVDPLRYYLLREIPYGQDGDFTIQRFEEKFNSDLANDLGNLASRVSNMIEKYLDGQISCSKDFKDEKIEQEVYSLTTQWQFDNALDLIFTLVSKANQYIEAEKPWSLAGQDDAKLKEVLQKLLNDMCFIAELLEPFLPETASKLNKHFTVDKIVKMEPLFPRL